MLSSWSWLVAVIVTVADVVMSVVVAPTVVVIPARVVGARRVAGGAQTPALGRRYREQAQDRQEQQQRTRTEHTRSMRRAAARGLSRRSAGRPFRCFPGYPDAARHRW